MRAINHTTDCSPGPMHKQDTKESMVSHCCGQWVLAVHKATATVEVGTHLCKRGSCCSSCCCCCTGCNQISPLCHPLSTLHHKEAPQKRQRGTHPPHMLRTQQQPHYHVLRTCACAALACCTAAIKAVSCTAAPLLHPHVHQSWVMS